MLKKVFLLQKALRNVLKSRLFTYKKPFFCTNLSLLLSKAILFHPPLPIRTTLNLLFAKNAAFLLLFALTLYAVKPEPRTDSNHCRRYPEKCSFQHSWLLDESRSFSQQSRFDRRFESSPGSREGRSPSGAFGSFRTSEKNKIVSLQEVSRFSKPRFTAHRQQLRTNKLKSFFRLAAVSLPGRHTPCAQITDAARNFGQRFCEAACANKRKNPSDICLRDFW